MSLYHQLRSNEKEVYKQFKPDFFDLIIVDECHRSSARDDSNWHEILNYFSSATQIGMTATPKETNDISNIAYFGEPIYTYSLKDGREDGFLAPYKVAILPLSKQLSEKAKAVRDLLAKHYMVTYDEAGSIGKRYRRQDAIGTPLCVTIDFDTENDNSVTIRDRDTMEQIRLPIDELAAYIEKKLEF